MMPVSSVVMQSNMFTRPLNLEHVYVKNQLRLCEDLDKMYSSLSGAYGDLAAMVAKLEMDAMGACGIAAQLYCSTGLWGCMFVLQGVHKGPSCLTYTKGVYRVLWVFGLRGFHIMERYVWINVRLVVLLVREPKGVDEASPSPCSTGLVFLGL